MHFAAVAALARPGQGQVPLTAALLSAVHPLLPGTTTLVEPIRHDLTVRVTPGDADVAPEPLLYGAGTSQGVTGPKLAVRSGANGETSPVAQGAGTRWLRLGLVERLLLKVIADMGATPDLPYQGCAPMVEDLYARHGIQPVHGYGALVRLAADWLVPLRLIDGHGNLGSADFPAAEMAYVEARLTPVGLLAAEHEALDGAIALSVGDLAFDGQRPPFELSGVRAAMEAVIDDPDADAEIVRRLIGSPVFVGGADAEGPLEALLDGDPMISV